MDVVIPEGHASVRYMIQKNEHAQMTFPTLSLAPLAPAYHWQTVYTGPAQTVTIKGLYFR